MNEPLRTDHDVSVRKQLTVYGIFLAVVVGVAILFLTVVNSVDNRDIPLEDTAPWTEAPWMARL